jgi:hypothetical protein
MTNRLLRYELALFRRSFADGFSRTRDRMLLAAILTLAALSVPGWLRQAADLQLPAGAALLGAAAFVPALAWQRLVAARLAWLAEDSALAADALHPRFRRSYLATAHLPVLVAVVATLLALAAAAGSLLALGVGLIAYAAGAFLPKPQPGLGGDRRAVGPPSRGPAFAGRHAAFAAILRRQTLDKSNPAVAAAAILAAIFAFTALGGLLVPRFHPAIAFAGALSPSLLALLAVGRLDPQLLGFLPFAGYRPWSVALLVSALPLACLAAAGAGVLLGGFPDPAAMILLLLLLYAVAIIYSVARSWLYFGRSSRAVELQVQIELAAAGALGTVFPPLVVPALAWRLAMLRRRYLASLWKSP